MIEQNPEVPEVTNFIPGESAGLDALLNKETGFLTSKRLKLYDTKRNDPNVPQALSNLSPYFHFGQLSS